MQTAYQYKNKGNANHLGGYIHAGLHQLATALILMFFIPSGIAILISFFEFYIHYLIDWSKVNIQKKLKWEMTTHEQYWWLLGFDQFLHQITYLGIAALALRHL